MKKFFQYVSKIQRRGLEKVKKTELEEKRAKKRLHDCQKCLRNFWLLIISGLHIALVNDKLKRVHFKANEFVQLK